MGTVNTATTTTDERNRFAPTTTTSGSSRAAGPWTDYVDTTVNLQSSSESGKGTSESSTNSPHHHQQAYTVSTQSTTEAERLAFEERSSHPHSHSHSHSPGSQSRDSPALPEEDHMGTYKGVLPPEGSNAGATYRGQAAGQFPVSGGAYHQPSSSQNGDLPPLALVSPTNYDGNSEKHSSPPLPSPPLPRRNRKEYPHPPISLRVTQSPKKNKKIKKK